MALHANVLSIPAICSPRSLTEGGLNSSIIGGGEWVGIRPSLAAPWGLEYGRKSSPIQRAALNEIENILRSGKSFLDESRGPVSSERLRRFEEDFGIELPFDYKNFVSLGGLAELGFDNLILSPDEIEKSILHLPGELLPMAEDGCGNAFCFVKSKLPDTPIVFFDHETSAVTEYAGSFVACIRAWRRH